MIIRTWPYGTRKLILVKDVYQGQFDEGIVLATEESPDESIEGVIVFAKLDEIRDVLVGDILTIVFQPGGPNGGQWIFEGDEPCEKTARQNVKLANTNGRSRPPTA